MVSRSFLELIAANLEALMEEAGWDDNQVALQSGVSKKTVNNIRRARHNASANTLAALATAFGVPPYQMLLPDLESSLGFSKDLNRLLNWFLQASPEGRANISRVARLEAKFIKLV